MIAVLRDSWFPVHQKPQTLLLHHTFMIRLSTGAYESRTLCSIWTLVTRCLIPFLWVNWFLDQSTTLDLNTSIDSIQRDNYITSCTQEMWVTGVYGRLKPVVLAQVKQRERSCLRPGKLDNLPWTLMQMGSHFSLWKEMLQFRLFIATKLSTLFWGVIDVCLAVK